MMTVFYHLRSTTSAFNQQVKEILNDLMRTLDVGKGLAAIAEFAEGAVKKSLHEVIAKMLGNQMLTLR